MYKKIGDYGIIGNSQTVALIGNDGSIDWLCLPSMDSASVFAAILDYERGGRFAVTPDTPWDSSQHYLPGTNLLVTTFRTAGGRLRLTDFMPVATDDDCLEERERQELYRCIEVTEGELPVRIDFQPSFDYARAETSLEMAENTIVAYGGGQRLVLQIHGNRLQVQDGRVSTRLQLSVGAQIWLLLVCGDKQPPALTADMAQETLEKTSAYWREWLGRSETGQDHDFGPFAEMIERSSLLLKLLDFAPSGAIAAAPTTSLPEVIGGERNWDYRYSWIRDSAMTVEALFNIGHLAEMENYLHWLERFVCEEGCDLQVLYGLRGETEVTEEELAHLEGYKKSTPVRIGNGAYDQKQLDIYGEIMDAALRLSNYVGKIDMRLWPFLRSICDKVVEVWQEPDSGIWEVRGGPWHFIYSKVMCWTALDRGLTIAGRYGFPGDRELWKETREAIRQQVMDKGWSESKKAFVQHYDTEELDASNLLLPFYGFIAYDDPRMVATAEAIQRELTEEGFVYRYRGEDGLKGREGTFQLCTFWLVDNLIGQGRLDEAQILLLRLERTANHLGLFAEEYDPFWREPLGNFPQAFTHIGYINSVFELCRTREEREREIPEKPLAQSLGQKLLFAKRYILNEGEATQKTPVEKLAGELKHLMNLLRGAFFKTDAGRIAYEEMAGSELYQRYARKSRELQEFDLEMLKAKTERIAFWVNLYNVLVIHGVIELGIRDSVKEVTRFFRRIGYRIGGMEFTADDIEHGILRGNHRFPGSLIHPFGDNDPRSKQVIEPLDPRIHFALVCASLTCPPIEVYSAKTLDEDLEISGRTFLNAAVRIDREEKVVRLPKIFQWYGEDFGETETDYIRFVAPYMFREEDRDCLESEADKLTVEYLDYDWRLNRSEPGK
ncbi:MAG: glycoside hydrolase family 15 protein [Desulfuromonadales bacterium]|nr:glycoside hydrolase family 15 protein [Desulfuromonadales bacterium]